MKADIFFMPDDETRTSNLTMKCKTWKKILQFANQYEFKTPSEAIEMIVECFFKEQEIKQKEKSKENIIPPKGDWD